jgi:hypothetical protein
LTICGAATLSDDAPLWDFIRAICCFDGFPIVAIYLSGKRSAHALARLDAASYDDWHAKIAPYREHLFRIGCCSGSLTPLRPSRLPNCVREETGQLQQLLYLSPDADSNPIAERPASQHPSAVLERYIEATRFGPSDNNYED